MYVYSFLHVVYICTYVCVCMCFFSVVYVHMCVCMCFFNVVYVHTYVCSVYMCALLRMCCWIAHEKVKLLYYFFFFFFFFFEDITVVLS